MSFFLMAKTVLKSLFRKPATRRYPFVVRPFYKNTRGKISIEIGNCIFCGICQKKCPTAAINVGKNEKKWRIDRLRCISCGYCVESCPKKCLAMENEYSQPVIIRKKEVFKNA
jgi:ech hydrogenase subunit F